MGAKSFIRTPEMQRNFALDDKLVYTMQKRMVSMSTINGILDHGVYIQNWSDTYCYLFLTIESGLIEMFRHSPFILFQVMPII